MQVIQNAFRLLQTSKLFIFKKVESLESELQKINLLQTENTRLTVTELSSELLNFIDNIKLECFRKITLEGETKSYKHLQTCLKKCSISVNFLLEDEDFSNFPLVRTAVYYLIDFHKTFVANIVLEKILIKTNSNIGNISNHSIESLATVISRPLAAWYQRIIEMSKIINLVCGRTYKTIDESREVSKMW